MMFILVHRDDIMLKVLSWHKSLGNTDSSFAHMYAHRPILIFTCVALAKSGLVVGPLWSAVRNILGLPRLCNL